MKEGRIKQVLPSIFYIYKTPHSIFVLRLMYLFWQKSNHTKQQTTGLLLSAAFPVQHESRNQ